MGAEDFTKKMPILLNIYSKKLPNIFHFENARHFPPQKVNLGPYPRSGRPPSSSQLPDIGFSGKVFFYGIFIAKDDLYINDMDTPKSGISYGIFIAKNDLWLYL